MRRIYKILAGAICTVPLLASCVNLDETVYSKVTEANYDYGNNIGTAIGGIYRYMRTIPNYPANFSAQEASADIIVMPANSTGWLNIGEYRRCHHHTWTSEEPQLKNMWSSFFGGVVLCNNVLELLNSGRLDVSDEEIEYARNEVRAVRAFYYWYLTDCFGDIPLVTGVMDDIPGKTSRANICSFVEKELLEVIPNLSEETGPEYYGRINRGAARTLLANLYLNWEVYTGTPRWEDCITQCDEIINSGKYSLESNYKDCFKAYGMETSPEIIFTAVFDNALGMHNNRLHCASWHSACSKAFSLLNAPYGSGCIKGVPQFIDTYDEDDSRLEDTWLMGTMHTPSGEVILCTYDCAGQPLEFTNEMPDGDYTNEKEGYRMWKFEVAENSYAQSDTDYPIFRYSEVLMMKAECLLRLGRSGAGALVTQVRERAFRNTDPSKAPVSDEELKEDSSYQYGYVENYRITDPGNQDPIKFGRMYDELGWEFAWECHRRRDAIRFGVYTTKSWLSHKPNGDYRIVFPIPESQISANPKLKQNPDYVTTVEE